MRTLALVVCAAALAAAQEQAKPEDKAIVEGVVLNAQTGEPLRKAAVLLVQRGREGVPLAASTDAAGKFRIAGLEPGEYHASVQRNGFVRLERQRGSMLALAKGQHLKGLAFKLEPAAVIAGRVTDEDGEPLAQARVEAMRHRYSRGGRELMPVGFATTDDLGNFRLFGLAAGRYHVRATYMGSGMYGARRAVQPRDEESYAPVYYPGAADPAHAVAVIVASGEEKRGVDLRLTPSRTVRIRGRVSGDPRAGQESRTHVMLMTRGSRSGAPDGFGRLMDRDGTFELSGVRPGAYTLYAISEYEGARLVARRDVEVADTSLDGIVLTLLPGVEIEGSVRVENASEPKPELSKLHVLLIPEAPGPGGTDGKVQANGTFTAKHVPPGDYRVRVVGLPERHYVSRARFGDADALAGPVTMGEGAAGPIEIAISGDAGTLQGLVTDADGKPVAGAAVTLRGSVVMSDGSDFAMTDEAGRYSFRSLRPGEYTVYAFDGAEPGAWEDPDFVQLYKDQGSKTTVQANGRHTLDLRAVAVKEQ